MTPLPDLWFISSVIDIALWRQSRSNGGHFGKLLTFRGTNGTAAFRNFVLLFDNLLICSKISWVEISDVRMNDRIYTADVDRFDMNRTFPTVDNLICILGFLNKII